MSSLQNFRRIAVLNRGEPLLRFLRTFREYTAERAYSAEILAVITDADRYAPVARRCDETIPLGPAIRTLADGSVVSAYCDRVHVVAALRRARVDAVWPGWGFASEDPAMVDALTEAGIAFIGPTADAMRRLGDKWQSKLLASKCDLPLSAFAAIEGDATNVLAAAEGVGYPLMVKASAGGGGRGIRKVNRPDELMAAIESARAEAQKAFGDGTVFMEACVTLARHIEVQFAADGQGHAVALGLRDCSVQRRHQKIIEEAPPPTLPAELGERLCQGSVRLALASSYRGVGTAEFLYQPATGAVTFLEVNARLQVEHTITELLTGLDLVALQLDIARGLPWPEHLKSTPSQRGHAIEVRVCAEDPERGFAPAPGTVRLFRPPAGPGIRVDGALTEGQTIPAVFDSMIAKVMAWAPTRSEALARLQRALGELEVVVEGGATNKAFLSTLLAHPEVIDGSATTSWLDVAVASGEVRAISHATEALMAAAALEYRRLRNAVIERFFAEANDGLPRSVPAPEGVTVDFRLRERRAQLQVMEVGYDHYIVGQPGAWHALAFQSHHDYAATLTYAGRRYALLFAFAGNSIAVEIDGTLHTVERVSTGQLRAPMPATVVRVCVAEGQSVVLGQPLVILEAMKMELAITAPASGHVERIACRSHEQMAQGQLLLSLSEEEQSGGATVGEPWPKPGPTPLTLFLDAGLGSARYVDALSSTDATHTMKIVCAAVRSVFCGYDRSVDHLLALEHALSTDLTDAAVPARWRPLAETLTILADVESIFDRSTLTAEAEFSALCRRVTGGASGAEFEVSPTLSRALTSYRVAEAAPDARTRRALARLGTARLHAKAAYRLAVRVIGRVVELSRAGLDLSQSDGLREALARLAETARPENRFVEDAARQALWVVFEKSSFEANRAAVSASVDALLHSGDVSEITQIRASILHLLVDRAGTIDRARLPTLAVALLCRLDLSPMLTVEGVEGDETCTLVRLSGDAEVAVVFDRTTEPSVLAAHLARRHEPRLEIIRLGAQTESDDLLLQQLSDLGRGLSPSVMQVTLTWHDARRRMRHLTLERGPGGDLSHETNLVGVHPSVARRLEWHRLSEFTLSRLTGMDVPEGIVAVAAKGRANPKDERLFVFAEVHDVPDRASEASLDARGAWQSFDHAFYEALSVLREAMGTRSARDRWVWNRLTIVVRPVLDLEPADVSRVSQRLRGPTRGSGLEKVIIRVRVRDDATASSSRATTFVVRTPSSGRLEVREHPLSNKPIHALTDYEHRLVLARRLAAVYPYEIIRMLVGGHAAGAPPHPDMANGVFAELDLVGESGPLRPTSRGPGENTSGLVVGRMTHFTPTYPDGLERIFVASDPTKAMGALAEPECRRLIAALDLAEAESLPVEYCALSAGARIAMDSGTENLDWTARVLRRLIEYTEKGGVIHVIVPGVNVGAQSYWNAEATMLMHTRGLLVMTPAGSMVLTGKKALEASGGVAAEDERGIGGHTRIMGPNGQAQYFADDLPQAYALVFEHYRSTYVRPGEKGPRRDRHAATDAPDRDVTRSPYEGPAEHGFREIGEIFSDATNPGRKKPFAIREVMRAFVDHGTFLERWKVMRDAETAVVWETHVGGHAVTLIGFESRPIARGGVVPVDGPDTFTGGTLFPMSSKKVARALNASSGIKPVVVLANLSGFDGSPESMRHLQLEYGAEIGRAVVRFQGPLVFVVIGRYHGGAYVVFSKALNENLTALALTGSYASVIGGGPAATVVFPREVKARAEADPRVVEARRAANASDAADRLRRRDAVESLLRDVILEKQGDVAREFDLVHSVSRAVEVGSLDAVIEPSRLRPAVIEVLDRERR
ncbi:MAG: fused acetyl/propionyl-CoA carboxylase subunit alpha/methylmalonyl-CoA decarboxylase subunit alpha [Myxococcales bacterium]|nr:fused acetyl/propionyl-CoA carboxylase subunit alpha/methylmalonyl-CoA decarboxylase subunit alpha [Myxococcales bacterium]